MAYFKVSPDLLLLLYLESIFERRQSNPVGEHAHMATPFLERGKIYKKIIFTKLLNVMHVWVLIICFLIGEID